MSLGVKFPFTIQGGSVAVTDNPSEMVSSQIVFCIGTMIGERVMHPLWGVDILSTVWSLGGDLDLAMREGIDAAFKRWFPAYEAKEIKVTRNSDFPSVVEIEVRFGKYESDVDTLVKVGTQLPGGTEIQTNEGF